MSFGGIFKDFDSELMWKENLRHTVSVEKERMDIFHFNMALIELLSMIFLQEKKAKAWLLPFCMFFAQQSRKAKANARLLSYESWQVAPRRSKWTEMGSSLRRYFAGYSTVWLSHDTYHGRPSIRSKLKIEWIDGWMDLLVGTGVNTALENVQWPKPFLTPASRWRSFRPGGKFGIAFSFDRW